MDSTSRPAQPLHFRGGAAGALLPFLLFLAGVVWLAAQGAPDERGFWPVLLAAIALAGALAHDRMRWADVVVSAMAQPIVALMVLAWLLSGVLGTVLTQGGLVESLIWVARKADAGPGTWTAAAFLTCALVSTATGTSFGTILVAGPLLYSAGGGVGADPAVLLGAVLAGATWGDSISPVSDTTIASAGSQETDVPGTVRSRLKYVVPAGALALLVSATLAVARSGSARGGVSAAGSPKALLLLAAPLVVVGLMARRRHLLEGLLTGIVVAVALAVGTGLIAWSRVFHIDAASFGAKGLIVDGLGRGVGVSIFTLLLMGLVGGVQASGIVDRVTHTIQRGGSGVRATEGWIVGLVSAATLLTTHSVVAMLTVGPMVRQLGREAGIPAYRRANLLDMTVCTWPFLLPWFLPTILASSASSGAESFGMPRVSPLAAGMANTYAWALVVTVVLAIATGYGRGDGRDT